MNTSIRSLSRAGLVCLGLALALPVHAGLNAAAVDGYKARKAAEAAAAANDGQAVPDRDAGSRDQDSRRNGRRDEVRPETRPETRDNRGDRNNDRGNDRANRDNDRGGFNLSTRPSGPDYAGRRERERERSLDRLPPGYRSYYWAGSPYYNYRGSWYRPYGGGYVSIGVPYGMFVSSLPPYYSTMWIGGTRYFVADDTYYLYEPSRGGCVVARTPYDGERVVTTTAPEAESTKDPVLFVYPTKGQSEKQQADDRYECHRWAVTQTGYNPVDAEYRPEQHAQYDRAITACLTGKGYSVK